MALRKRRDRIRGNPDLYHCNDGFFRTGGGTVQIGGTSYVPPLPIETVVIERIDEIRSQDKEPIEIAIELCMYCMKTQVFKDGNKRASVIFANHYLIAHGMGFLVIPEKDVPEFKKLLVQYYEGDSFDSCHRRFGCLYSDVGCNEGC